MEERRTNSLLQITTFGGLRIMQGGIEVTGSTSRKVEALLIFLALQSGPQTREFLANLFWDDRSQSQALANLRTMLTHLRKHYGPFISVSRNLVSFESESEVWMDAVMIEKNLALFQTPGFIIMPETAKLIDAYISFYKGDFLEGFYVRDAASFENWMTNQREKLRHIVIEALSEVITYYQKREEYKSGISSARRLLQIDPLREQAHRQLMELFALSGERGLALDQYESCRKLLEEELGVSPMLETTLLYEQIRAGAENGT